MSAEEIDISVNVKREPTEAAPELAPLPYPDGISAYLELRGKVPTDFTIEAFWQVIEDGFFPGGQFFPEAMRREHLLVLLVDELNTVIEAFNIILRDLYWLPILAEVVGGSYSKRIDL